MASNEATVVIYLRVPPALRSAIGEACDTVRDRARAAGSWMSTPTINDMAIELIQSGLAALAAPKRKSVPKRKAAARKAGA